MNSGHRNLDPGTSTAAGRVAEGLRHDGVAILPGLVPSDLCAAARDAIDTAVGADASPESWYRQAPSEAGAVPLHQHPAFWAIRQLPAVYDVFRSLLASPFLWVSMGHGSFKPPFRADHPEWSDQAPFHWDIDPREPDRHLQAMIYLADCDASQGPFQCVPYIYRNPDPWWSIYGLEPFAEQRIRAEEIHRVPAPAGSLVLWDARLPHGSGVNRGTAPRYSLDLTMYREGSEARRAERVADFEARRAPAWWRRDDATPEPGPAPTLSDLGERLLGRLAW